MKTITMDFELYESEKRQQYSQGFDQGVEYLAANLDNLLKLKGDKLREEIAVEFDSLCTHEINRLAVQIEKATKGK